MKVPIRAIYGRRAPGDPEREPVLLHADYAEVPDALVLGAAAQTALDLAQTAGDVDAAEMIASAIARATADGVLMKM